MDVRADSALHRLWARRILQIVALVLFLAVVLSSNPSFHGTASLHRNVSNVGEAGSMISGSPSLSNQPVADNINFSVHSVTGFLSERKIPATFAYLPNAAAASRGSYGAVSSGYASYPAPMGVADYGLNYVNGRTVAYNLSASRVEGRLQLNASNAFYPGTSTPSDMSIQLNSVLNGVSVRGNATYDYWAQNVALYSSTTHQLRFVDNVWNFSGSSLTSAAFYAYSTQPRDSFPLFYYGLGPAVTVQYPFAVTLFLQSAIVGGRNAVFFNYSVSDSTSAFSGSYDEVIFNSLPTGQAAYSAPEAHFLASGTTKTPLGLPNDIEFVIGGPGGGSTTTLYSLNGSMTLSCSSRTGPLSTVPSAYDFGSDSGETSDGIAVAWSASGAAILNCGPSMLYGMWNASQSSHMVSYSGRITPSNAFLFVSSGNYYAPASASWVPLPPSGYFSFLLPFASYAARVMLSNYVPLTLKLSSVLDVTMKPSLSEGVYTPLYAMTDAQAADISFAGNGSGSAPYFLFDNTVRLFSFEFSAANALGYPVFCGFMIKDLSHVQINGLTVLRAAEATGGQVSLPDILYNTTHVSVWKTQFSVLSPFSALFNDARLFPDLTVADSNMDIIGSSSFTGGFAGLYMHGGSGNYVWGNSFLDNESYPGVFGIIVNSSGNTVFNNYFWGERIPAFSYFTNSGGAVQLNRWNISREPSSSETFFCGHVLYGSIIGTNYQGGNYWWNFNGVTPFDEGGLVSVPDYVPLVPPSTLNFTEHGLPAGSGSTLLIGGSPVSLSSRGISLYLPDGTYAYAVSPTRYYYPTPGSGVVKLHMSHVDVRLDFMRFAFISGQVNPHTSRVTVGGTLVPVINGTFSVPVHQGSSTVVVVSSGYMPFSKNLTMTGGENRSLKISLLPEQHAFFALPLPAFIIATLFSATAVLSGVVRALRGRRREEQWSGFGNHTDERYSR